MSSSRPGAALLAAGLALVGVSCGGADASPGTKAVAARTDAGASTTAPSSRASASDAMQGDEGDGRDRGPGGEGGDGGPDDGGRGRGGPGGAFGDLTSAAGALGMTADELRTATASGQTIAQVAASKGVPVETVVAALVAAMKAHFDQEVASGEHTQAEADASMADATAMVTAIVNGQQPQRPGGDDGPGGDDDHGGDAGSSGGTARKARVATTTTMAA